MAHKKRRVVVFILNAAPEGEKFTSLQRAERLSEVGKAEWIDPTTIRLIRDGEREAIRMEMAARVRRMGEEEVTKRIEQSRYGRASWNGEKRKGIPWFERDGMMPISPGMVRS